MWTLRAQPGWERRELRAPREEREVEETRDTPAECAKEH
ncbi:hypothetical protein HNR06_002694 [Nocardiopsis arvandica]|uniref:Uncharacterized protein n=1 Tax=Nocardiopsis sinuspersici TaxID=501010 RepID=A0A7Y9XEW6_9ACTN|nr:hypothetical protein [Nocardiopsis sinuspersici]